MYICVCKGISDRRIRRAVEQGAAISLRDLTRELGVGTCCGKCVPAARELLNESCNPPARRLSMMETAQAAVAI